MFTDQDYSAIAFSNQHWNTFIDLTNDCFPDFVLTNDQNAIEFWIYSSQSKTFLFSKPFSTQIPLKPAIL